jgi:hypothetical protein
MIEGGREGRGRERERIDACSHNINIDCIPLLQVRLYSI